MRIGIDARYLSHGLVGGVHTYVKHFVPALAGVSAEHELILYVDTKRPFELTGLPSHVSVRTLPWTSPLSSLRHDLFLHRAMAADSLDVVHFPANYGFGPPGVKTVVTLHDAINILPLREILRGHRRNPRTVAMMTYLHLCTRQALRRATLVMTVSRHARQEISARGGFPMDRIVAIPHAPTPDLQRVVDPVRLLDIQNRLRIERPFVLADALKNPSTVVHAWRRLPDTLKASHTVVFFSRSPDVLPIVRSAVETGDALLLQRPSRSDLIGLYSMASAFVFPSWIEGFGIPVLEAMTCGAPVIASDRGSLPEVVGSAGLLADAEDVEGFATHLRAILECPQTASTYQQRGYARAATFSWEYTARHILETYCRAAQMVAR